MRAFFRTNGEINPPDEYVDFCLIQKGLAQTKNQLDEMPEQVVNLWRDFLFMQDAQKSKQNQMSNFLNKK